jgi:hypothetical protein
LQRERRQRILWGGLKFFIHVPILAGSH